MNKVSETCALISTSVLMVLDTVACAPKSSTCPALIQLATGSYTTARNKSPI